jgi:hypothetical protein
VTLSWLDEKAQKHLKPGLSLSGSSYDSPTVSTTYTLTASNDIGQNSATATVSINPPRIATLTASPNNGYINLGDTATLTWAVANCQPGCNVTVQGTIDASAQPIVFSRGHLPASGSLPVTPTGATLTHYTLTAQDAAGTAPPKTVTVQVYAPAPASCNWFFFQMKNSSSTVTPCFGLAICATDADTAKKIAQQQNQGYTATDVSYQQFVQGCS